MMLAAEWDTVNVLTKDERDFRSVSPYRGCWLTILPANASE
ncbi:hypothetical protein [Streptomyces gardneri]|uniref:Uncharacterized protein n=1 Tax=Streptomyces gardneri TaxID=66892 RepID=A0A4Y3RVZ8_9ACTN|nr:hypothetical protein [Streptomyces gardneri]GEB60110.1 hypothetical protein SGA01_57150 [Streptomyces gardneri]GHH21307.1 hypothetical protein GCM10017674_75930 [Streptomyces gardneri]